MGNRLYAKINDINGKKRKLRHNAIIYNVKGKRLNGMLKKRNQKILTYGSAIKIKGKKYYMIGKNEFIKKNNF